MNRQKVNFQLIKWLGGVKVIAMAIVFANLMMVSIVVSAAYSGVNLQVGYDFDFGAKMGIGAP